MTRQTSSAMYFPTPNWNMQGSASHLESELSGFEFQGPGWYLTDTDTVLVLPGGEHRGVETFRAYVWNGEEAMVLLTKLLRMQIAFSGMDVEKEWDELQQWIPSAVSDLAESLLESPGVEWMTAARLARKSDNPREVMGAELFNDPETMQDLLDDKVFDLCDGHPGKIAAMTAKIEDDPHLKAAYTG